MLNQIFDFSCANQPSEFSPSRACGPSDTSATAFSPSGSHLAFGFGRSKIILIQWDLDSNRARDEIKPQTLECGEKVCSLSFGQASSSYCTRSTAVQRKAYSVSRLTDLNGLLLAAGLNSGRIKIFSVSRGCLLLYLIDHCGMVHSLDFAPNGSLILISGSKDSTLKLWNLFDDGNMFKTLHGHRHNSMVLSCCWSPCSQLVASTGSDRQVLVWNTASWTVSRHLNLHNHDVVKCQFSRSGFLLATASADTSVILWNPWTGEALRKLPHMSPSPSLIFASGQNGHLVRSLAFLGEEDILTLCEDGFLRIWNLAENSQEPKLKFPIGNPVCCSLSPNGFALCIGAKFGHAMVYSTPMQCSNLVNLCRASIRNQVLRPFDLQVLPLPQKLLHFLM